MKIENFKRENYKLFCTKQHVVMEYMMEKSTEIHPDKIKV